MARKREIVMISVIEKGPKNPERGPLIQRDFFFDTLPSADRLRSIIEEEKVEDWGTQFKLEKHPTAVEKHFEYWSDGVKIRIHKDFVRKGG